MIKVSFLGSDGADYRVAVPEGLSLMEAATKNGVPGIDAECGGGGACATCQVYIAPEWMGISGAMSDLEADLLEDSPHLEEGSRLACQVRLTAALDGLVVRIPASQF